MAKRKPLPPAEELFGPKGGPDKEKIDNWADIMLGPSPISVTTTSTTNPMKPRTLAAGYNSKTKTLTVVFRDGTWWNYYDVESEMWEGFRQAESKGKFLKESGLDSWDSMGRADMSSFTPEQRDRLQDLADRAQENQVRDDGRQEESAKMGPQFNPTLKGF